MSAAPVGRTFTMVCPEHVAELGPAAAILYARIAWRTEGGPWRATRRDLADETGLTLGMIRSAVQLLRDRGWVVTERASADDATLVWKAVCAGQPDKADSAPPPAESAIPPSRISTTPPAESALSSYETGRDQETPPTSPPPAVEQSELPLLSLVPADEPSGLDAEFDGFWNAYPRKVGKPKAKAAYRSARKRASLDEIAGGLRCQLPDLRGRDRGLVPYPATWLNQDRWADDPADAALARTGPRNYDMERIVARNAGQSATVSGPAALAISMLGASS